MFLHRKMHRETIFVFSDDHVKTFQSKLSLAIVEK